MKAKPISDQLRKAILKSDMSRYRICQEVDMDEGHMSRFMKGKAGVSVNLVERIAASLRLHLNLEPTPSRKRR